MKVLKYDEKFSMNKDEARKSQLLSKATVVMATVEHYENQLGTIQLNRHIFLCINMA